ncbi:MAG: hypothetical protein LBT43_04960 [Prevotella sp.]|nr:hypothetical protein [Prevotella sp.]
MIFHFFESFRHLKHIIEIIRNAIIKIFYKEFYIQFIRSNISSKICSLLYLFCINR